jgi:hypothetical protein
MEKVYVTMNFRKENSMALLVRKILIDEINCWAKIVFETEYIFTILGI